MKINVNGQQCTVESNNLDDVLHELGYANAIVATAVNSNFVSVGNRKNIMLNDFDQVEILAPMQGG